jgi:hypothetical protein
MTEREIEIIKEGIKNVQERARIIISEHQEDSRNSDECLIILFWHSDTSEEINLEFLENLTLEKCSRLTSPASILRGRANIQNVDFELIPTNINVLKKRIRPMTEEKQKIMLSIFDEDEKVRKERGLTMNVYIRKRRRTNTIIRKEVKKIYKKDSKTWGSYKLLIAKFWASELNKRSEDRGLTKLSWIEIDKHLTPASSIMRAGRDLKKTGEFSPSPKVQEKLNMQEKGHHELAIESKKEKERREREEHEEYLEDQYGASYFR